MLDHGDREATEMFAGWGSSNWTQAILDRTLLASLAILHSTLRLFETPDP